MPVVQVAYAPSRENYEKVAALVRLADDRPNGLILHTAHELPDGRVQIVDVYDSSEALHAVGEERVIPAFASAGVLELAMAEGRPTAYEAFDVVAGGSR